MSFAKLSAIPGFDCWCLRAGCGKTALVEELARLTGNVDMVRVHVDDQMDSKSLLGAYVCTSNPEEFVWQPGPLTQVTVSILACHLSLRSYTSYEVVCSTKHDHEWIASLVSLPSAHVNLYVFGVMKPTCQMFGDHGVWDQHACCLCCST